MNQPQILADRMGKAAVYRYLTESFGTALKIIWDTNHKSEYCKIDFIVEYKNNFLNFIDAKSRSVSSTTYNTSRISANKIHTMFNHSQTIPNSLPFIYVYYNDGNLYQFNVNKIVEKYDPVYNYARESALSKGNKMKYEQQYDIDFSDAFFCGNYQITPEELDRQFFDYQAK